MIESKYGAVIIRGTEAEIMADYTCIIRAVKKTLIEKLGEEKAAERIATAAARAEAPMETLMAEALEKAVKNLQNLTSQMRSLATAGDETAQK